jgi:hypothetical protein
VDIRRPGNALFSYVSIEERIPPNHPLSRIRPLADPALHQLYGVYEVFYARDEGPLVLLANCF